MSPSDVQQALAQVISDMLAEARASSASIPGYLGMEISNLSSDGCEFDLALTFKAGAHYCCIEWGCHLALYSSEWFQRVKERLRALGVANLPPMTVRNLHVRVEKGAISNGPGNVPLLYENHLEYDVGPFHEVDLEVAEQTGS